VTEPTAHPYQSLTPDIVLDAVEATGIRADGCLLALNSYENRVYQIGVEEGETLVAKFYRPGRWSDEAIQEEHDFAAELEDRDIPAVPPLPDPEGHTLRRHAGFRFALFPRRGGRWPELEDPDTQFRLGRLLGRLHAVGAIRPFAHRPTLNVESVGDASREYLLGSGFLPRLYEGQYRDLTEELLAAVREGFEAAGEVAAIRLHGDCHPGNILWTEQGGHFVDLDDARMGPAVQDLWMLLSGERHEMIAQLSELLEGYDEFYEFNPRELQLIEPLRTLRMIQYAAWLARRWDDPAFPAAFPWFNTEQYWEEHILSLREQAMRLEQPPLKLGP